MPVFAFIVNNEAILRALFAGGGLLLFLCLGLIFRFRLAEEYFSPSRIATNIALSFINTLLIKLLIPISLVGVAIYAQEKNIGVLNKLWLVDMVGFFVGLCCLDLAIYWQHRIFHQVPQLWRIHRVHHSDTGLDTSTALRFHPLEIIISFFIKSVVILSIGVSPAAVIVFEIVLNFSALFHHGNYKLPKIIDGILRWFIVTPDHHRVHHSTNPKEMNSNYAFFLTVWDRIFYSFTQTTERRAEFVQIGLPNLRNSRELTLWYLIKQPFKML